MEDLDGMISECCPFLYAKTLINADGKCVTCIVVTDFINQSQDKT